MKFTYNSCQWVINMRYRNGVVAKRPQARGVPLKYIFVETTHRNKDKHHLVHSGLHEEQAEERNLRVFLFISGSLRRLQV